ncbi:MAG: hypothetical protein NWT08_08825 [Akkermansiaceae bacterium]|jgi:hypothetical protein|nr:hypothetical protein [Akkermansiaceae bacterium]MDP4648046.1 hypothetical protein [Akkermansiaceae bacterium]MDP4720301.1 hypothetical protein [Akkermansiaceae bacterium]MDP4781394.1 hypothetical protein [Akkermansiaceae bacterium]MDP4847827.1 hypothetical protein [Akkermansiaceae bacterium]
MRQSRPNRYPGGYISFVAVFTISVFMLMLMVFAYDRAINAHAINADIQASTDYQEKEEATLRAIVAIVPNRAIRAMQHGSNASNAVRNPLRFVNIFSEALTEANAAQSISPELLAAMNLGTTYSGNSGDTTFANIGRVFRRISGSTGNVTPGVGVDLGVGYPPALDYTNGALASDPTYPLITSQKIYGTQASGKVGLATSSYPNFNLIPYPNINFGYSTPGQPFVAKRNWWAFTMDLAGQDIAVTKVADTRRTYVLSLYEIPSQLPISASSFMALGEHADGSAWTDVEITGNVFAGKAIVEGNTELSGLASRRGFELSEDATVGGKSFSGNPFAPGVRETFRLTEGDFFPVSMASESGKAAFVPINRGADYFDRFSHNLNESTTLSPTTWNNYSVGAMQCAMQLDVTAADPYGSPTRLRFRYYSAGVRQEVVKDWGGEWTLPNMPPLGYMDVGDENDTVTFTTPHDLAYGKIGDFAYIDNFTGTIRFDNATFGDPRVGTRKRGFARPVNYDESNTSPFDFKDLPSGKKCITVLPERIPNFLVELAGSGTSINHSLVVNVDYITNTSLTKPLIPCTETDWGVILGECGNMTGFTKGFSLVTNLRLYIGDDFNIVETTPPAGYTPASGKYYPPCSLFAPEKRYGVDYDPYSVEVSGQLGSVAAEDAANPVRPLDAMMVSGGSMDTTKMKVNLSAINHPAELPPITMMNWLMVIEELRNEFK